MGRGWRQHRLWEKILCIEEIVGWSAAYRVFGWIDAEPRLPDETECYRTAGGIDLSLDLYVPAEDARNGAAIVFIPGGGWSRIADLPRPTVAAACLPYGQSHILVFGGDDGSLVDQIQELKDDHPGFSKKVYAYHTITDTWTELGSFPEGYVTTQAVIWGDRIVIPGGEDRPGHRGDQVKAARLEIDRKSFSWADYAAILIYLGLGLKLRLGS